MNKIIFGLLLLPILLIGVCAVSASSYLDANIPVIGLDHPALVDHVASERPTLVGHVASDLPGLVGHVAIEPISSIGPVASGHVASERPVVDDHVAIEPISSICPVASGHVASERPALDGNFTDDNGYVPIVPIIIIDYDNNNQSSERPGMDIPSSASIIEDSNMEVFPYYPFGLMDLVP